MHLNVCKIFVIQHPVDILQRHDGPCICGENRQARNANIVSICPILLRISYCFKNLMKGIGHFCVSFSISDVCLDKLLVLKKVMASA